MIRKLALSSLFVMMAGTVLATTPLLKAYRDVEGLDCNLDYPVGLAPVNVVLTASPGANAVQFSAPLPTCWTNAIWLSDSPRYGITIGNSQDGTLVLLGACGATGPIVCLAINYFVNGPNPSCCEYPMLPDPSVPSGEIEAVTCGGSLYNAAGGVSIIGSGPGCACGTVANEQTTWGRLKSVYFVD